MDELGFREDGHVGWDGGGHALDAGLLEGSEHAPACGLPVLGPHDELGHQVVVVLAHGVPGRVPRVEPDARTRGLVEARDEPRRRHEATPGRVLGVDADLDRVPEAPDVLLAQPERLPGCDPDLPGDEVEAGHQLRDGVLHLEACVHLEEVELPVLEQELDGAGVLVAARLGDPHRRLAHGLTDVVGEVGGRALLDELLVAPLGGTITFAEPQRVAMRSAMTCISMCRGHVR